MVQYYYYLAITLMFVLCLYLYVFLFLSLCVYSVYFFSRFLVLPSVSSFSLNIPFSLSSSPLSLLLSLPPSFTSFSPLLLNCVQFFNDNANNQDSLSRTEAILMTCLLLPTQHLLCLQVSDSSYPLQSLLNVVKIYNNTTAL